MTDLGQKIDETVTFWETHKFWFGSLLGFLMAIFLVWLS